MKSKSVFDSEHFVVDIKNGISIIAIKVPRATFKEAEAI